MTKLQFKKGTIAKFLVTNLLYRFEQVLDAINVHICENIVLILIKGDQVVEIFDYETIPKLEPKISLEAHILA